MKKKFFRLVIDLKLNNKNIVEYKEKKPREKSQNLLLQ